MSRRNRKDTTFCDISSSDDDFHQSSDRDENIANSDSEVRYNVFQFVFRRYKISGDSEDESEEQINEKNEANIYCT